MSYNLETNKQTQELTALCVEYLAATLDTCPSEDERHGLCKDVASRCSTQVLYAATQKDFAKPVIFGTLAKGNRSVLDAPTVCVDSNNILWLGFTGRAGLCVRAVLLDGEFFAVERERFTPRRQTVDRYGHKVADLAASLDHPLAEWLRYHFGHAKGIQRNAPESLVMKSNWSRATLFQAKLAFQAIHDFYALDPEIHAIVATFLADGMAADEAVLAAQSICI